MILSNLLALFHPKIWEIIRAWLLFLFALQATRVGSSSPTSLPQSDCTRETHGTHETNYLPELKEGARVVRGHCGCDLLVTC